jgi:Tfp pilus assembly protein PilO
MPKLKQSDLMIIVLMVLVIAVIGWGIYSYAAQIARVSADRHAEEAKLAKIRDQVANFSKLQAEEATNEAEMQRLATYIPDREGQADFITELSRLTVGSGVKLKSCRAAEQATPFPNLPEYLIYQWDVTLESVYPQLLKFLETLPVEERSTLVSKINISAGEPDAAKGQPAQYILNVQLTLDLISKAGAPDTLTQTNQPAPVAQTGIKKVSK